MVCLRSHKGQTAAELAIFGAILIFVIGLIVRTAMSTSQGMNQQLKAMRLAMTESYKSSIGRGDAGNTARNAASITIVEDRLSIDPSDKLGSRDRIPLMVTGSGMMTNQLFQPIEFGEWGNLALYDVFINGQQFPLLTSGFRQIELGPTLDGKENSDWVDDCYTLPDPNDATKTITYGCAKVYKIVGNFAPFKNWCAGDASGRCSENLPAYDRFNLDRDKDTGNADGSDVPFPGCVSPPNDLQYCTELRRDFGWQWIIAIAIKKETAAWAAMEAGGKIKDSTGAFSLDELPSIKPDDTYDIDGDFKEEIVYDFNCYGAENGGIGPNGVIRCARIADSQQGDIDLTQDDRTKYDCRQLRVGTYAECRQCQRTPAPGCGKYAAKPLGLQDDVQMFSFTKSGGANSEEGTYLLIEEGKLFDAQSRRFIRSTNRQNHVDIIQRVFRLSRDTNRFCDATGNPTCWNETLENCQRDPNVPLGSVGDLKNPVEACGNCFACPDPNNCNVVKTCMDEDEKVIYIRSRIADMRGRRWVTKLSE